MAASTILRNHGLEVAAKGGQLVVAPASRLTDDLREYIRQHKAAILAELVRDPIAEAAHRHGLDPSHLRDELAQDDIDAIERDPPGERQALEVFAGIVAKQALHRARQAASDDNRVTCATCRNLNEFRTCRVAHPWTPGTACAPIRKPDPARPRRCDGYRPSTPAGGGAETAHFHRETRASAQPIETVARQEKCISQEIPTFDRNTGGTYAGKPHLRPRPDRDSRSSTHIPRGKRHGSDTDRDRIRL